jgi:exodeoxyribonuclease VII large subunit
MPTQHFLASGDGDPEAVVTAGSFTVGQILNKASVAIRAAMPQAYWVRGEVLKYNPHSSGHHYIELVERSDLGTQMCLTCAVWKRDWPVISRKLRDGGVTIAAGQQMLFYGRLGVYTAQGKLTLSVTDVYPEFTLGVVEAQRRALVERLTRERLIGLNRKRHLPDLPKTIALLSSRSADGRADFLGVIRRSGYAFLIHEVEIPLQGATLAAGVCSALKGITEKYPEIDAICIVRGGGGKGDLSGWNNYEVCAAIAKMPVPVIIGIGHEKDGLVLDKVVHTTETTPTAAANFLSGIFREADERMRTAGRELLAAVESRFSTLRQNLEQQRADCCRLAVDTVESIADDHREKGDSFSAHARRLIGTQSSDLVTKRVEWSAAVSARLLSLSSRVTGWRQAIQSAAIEIRAVARRLDTEAGRISSLADAQLRRNRGHMIASASSVAASAKRRWKAAFKGMVDAGKEIAVHSTRRIAEARTKVGHLNDLVCVLDPAAILRRGFSITFDEEGRAVRSPAAVKVGTQLQTRVAEGTIASVVTSPSVENPT